jgi:hypothetical protein
MVTKLSPYWSNFQVIFQSNFGLAEEQQHRPIDIPKDA